MRRNRYLGATGQTSDPAICSGDLNSYKTYDFPLRSDVNRVYLMFMCYNVA